MLMKGGREKIICAGQLKRRQFLTFPVTTATSDWQPSKDKAREYFVTEKKKARKMPSQEKKAMFFRCMAYNQMEIPTVAWKPERTTFISQINHSSWVKPCCLGKFYGHFSRLCLSVVEMHGWVFCAVRIVGKRLKRHWPNGWYGYFLCLEYLTG